MSVMQELLEIHRRLGQLLAEMQRHAPATPAPLPTNVRFDYSDREHWLAAEQIFDDLKINERRRSWLYNNVLNDGVPLSELRRVIEEQDATYKRRYPHQAVTPIDPFRVRRNDGSRSTWNGKWGRRQ